MLNLMFMSLLRIYHSRKRRTFTRRISAYKPMNNRVFHEATSV